jgi:DNA-binding transcriptional regulator YhcF (GntR family)
MSNELLVLSFAEAKQPEYKEKKGEGGGYIEFGHKNEYPNYLVDLFNKSAKHNAIIKGKVNYITGNGFKIVGDTDPIGEQFIASANQSESLTEVLRKVSTDIEIFGGAYLQIIWSQVGENLNQIYHIDYTKVRANEDNTQYWYSDNWKDSKYKREVYNAFNSQLRTGTQILYLKEYRPNLNAYALPGYFGALNYIESDIEISKHVLGNAQTGFSASKLITLPNGEPTDDEKRTIERKFTDRFTGSDGKKFILSFTNDASRKPIVDDLGASDITKEDFQNVDKLIQQNLYAGHQITAPDLFGISTPGQLGSRQQMRDSYEIFKNTYVNDKQIYLEQVFSLLAKLHGATSELQIVPVEPIAIEFDNTIIAANLTKDEIREKLGMPALEAKTTSTIQDTVDAINSLSPLVATKVLNSMTANEIRAIVGLIPTESGEQVVPDGATFAEFSKTKFSEDDIIAMFAEYGESRSDYAIFKTREVFSSSVNDMEEEMNMEFAEQALTVLEANILDLIQKDKRISAEIIAGTIKTDVNIVKRVLEGLKDRKIIKSTNENGTTVNVLVNPLSKLNAPKPQTTTFQLRYSYQFKTIIPINERNSIDHPSRPFCARLMQLDRLYTRAEIESLSARLGYSVFDRRGGWWTMPNGEASPSCRHRWMTETVIKKG